MILSRRSPTSRIVQLAYFLATGREPRFSPLLDEPGILSSILSSDGNDWDLLYVPAGGSRTPIDEEVLKSREQYIKMKGNDVFKVAVKSIESATINAIKEADLEPEDIVSFRSPPSKTKEFWKQ